VSSALNVVQIESSRRNALLSTGPRAEAGRHRSRLNALRHGLTARIVVLPRKTSSRTRFSPPISTPVSSPKPSPTEEIDTDCRRQRLLHEAKIAQGCNYDCKKIRDMVDTRR
jgi:hypothetical protein